MYFITDIRFFSIKASENSINSKHLFTINKNPSILKVSDFQIEIKNK